MKTLILSITTAALLAASPTIPTDQVQQIAHDLNAGHGDDRGGDDDHDDHGHMPKTPEPASFVLGALGIAGIALAQRLRDGKS